MNKSYRTLSLLLLFSLIILAACRSSSITSDTKTQAADAALQMINTSSQLPDSGRLHAQQIEEGKKYLRNNWMNLIHVKNGDYKSGKNKTGIYQLTIEVENTTAYLIDSMKFLVPFYAKG